MPTVHLALPESIYNELKERANEMGIQVTDLIKLYIRMGLGGGLSRSEGAEAVNELSKRLEKLEKEQKVKVMLLEGKLRQIEDTLSYIIEQIELLEEAVAHQRSRKIAEESS